MDGTAGKTPFRWPYAVASAAAGATAASVLLAFSTYHGGWMPIVTYVIGISFSAGFGFLLYLGRNSKSGNIDEGIYDPSIGNMGDFGAGTGTSSWGRMGQDVIMSDESTAASRRNDL